jgi:hypothetical protein
MQMRSKRLPLILACLAVALTAGYVTLRLTAPRPNLILENIGRIEDGMTVQEVEKILGAPAGNYSSLRDAEAAELNPCYHKPGDKIWLDDEMWLGVRFDEAGKVTTWDFYRHRRNQNKTFLDYLRSWLGM